MLKVLSILTISSISCSESVNKPPYFLPGGDFSSFSIPENFQVGTSVYKLKGKFDDQCFAKKIKLMRSSNK